MWLSVIYCWMFMCSLCVFFFKQKTAFEMRISDWSSDVCSSDLHHSGTSRRDLVRERGANCHEVASHRGHQVDAVVDVQGEVGRAHQRAGQEASREIGRASGRERVCQYV